MRRTIRKITIAAVLMTIALSVRAADVKGARFDFVPAGDPLGWGNAHDAEIRNAPGQPLVLRATGGDPFFLSPPVSLPAAASGEFVMQAAFTGEASQIHLFFRTEKDGRWGEEFSYRAPVNSDGVMHEVVVPVGLDEAWQGRIIQYRLDPEPAAPGDAMRLASISYRYGTAPQLGDLRTSASTTAPGEPVAVAIDVINPTPDVLENLAVRFDASAGATIGARETRIVSLPSEGSIRVRSSVTGKTESIEQLQATLLHGGKEVARRTVAIAFTRGGPDPGQPEYAVEIPEDGSWAMVKSPRQALVLGLAEHSGLAEWWAANGDAYERVGRIFPVASLLHGEKEPQLEIAQWTAAVRFSTGGDRLLLTGEFRGANGPLAMLVARFDSSPSTGPWLSAEVELEAKQRLHLRAFRSPRLLVGEGAFGADRNEALFPGLEYLEAGERSSSRLDIHTAEHLRTVPHPKKITATLMAATQGDRLLALMWPKPEPDGPGLRAPSAGFASPNFVDGQANHLMTLFWPSVPTFVEENEWAADSSQVLEPGDKLALNYDLVALQAEGLYVADAMDIWFQRYGDPELQESPREAVAERALCREAYTRTAWNEKARGWHHAMPSNNNQWAPAPFAFNIQYLETEQALLPPGKERREVEDVLKAALAERDKRTRGGAGAEDYYFAGDTLLECIEARERQARSIMQSQGEDGSWRFHPGDERRAQLGNEGDTEIGIVAGPANILLRYAVMTGDEQATSAGLKALEFMERFTIPRAAQVWEIPVHTPDIMGSAAGAEAYRLGYLLTGEIEYLERARYWLDTGLPFVYFWGHPQWKYWDYATIPVFGATFYEAPNWIGLPVQWCGLVYAEEALRFAALTDNGLYWRVGEGIVRSGLWQQDLSEQFYGLLPDSYAFAAEQGRPPYINPETILRPYWLLHGYDFRVSTVILEREGATTIRISAPAYFETVEAVDGNPVRVSIRAVEGIPCGVLICGFDQRPSWVLWGNQQLRQRAKLTRAETGWHYVPDRGWLLINVLGKDEAEDLLIQGNPVLRRRP